MSWLWKTSSSNGDAQQAASRDQTEASDKPGISLTEEQRLRIFGKSGRPAEPGDHLKRKQQEQQQADKELETFLRSFENPTNPVTNVFPTASDSETPPRVTEEERTTHDRILPDGSLDISPAVMYPRTMSCRQAFDQAFYCQSLGGKFNDIYRYGSLQSCSEQWAAFWFCMRNRTFSGKNKEERIASFYQDREEKKKKEHGSSEDVWEIRRVAVTSAFGRDPDEAEGEHDVQE